MSGPFSFSRKLKPSIGRASTRTLGWGDRAVTFCLLDRVEEGRRVGTQWVAERNGRRAAVWLDVFTADPSWAFFREVYVSHHDSLEAALYAAREWLLDGEA